ncbi:MAG: sigma-70 family RNA polymerase sigma factor [Flavobacteriales bacterium]|nr:sigma-70 family RNA polymerase sigma factor [Flavobacteriales bacterium]
MEDHELLIRLRRKDERAFLLLVDLHQDRVFNLCFSYLRDIEEAKDTAQEVFVEVMRSAESFRGQSTISTWIYRIAVNKSLDRLRYLGRDKRSAEEQPHTENLHDHASNPQQVMEEEERRAMLHRAIDSLPENQKTALILFNFEGLSYQEIAGVMDTSVSSVESLIFRSKKNLKEVLTLRFAEWLPLTKTKK